MQKSISIWFWQIISDCEKHWDSAGSHFVFWKKFNETSGIVLRFGKCFDFRDMIEFSTIFHAQVHVCSCEPEIYFPVHAVSWFKFYWNNNEHLKVCTKNEQREITQSVSFPFQFLAIMVNLNKYRNISCPRGWSEPLSKGDRMTPTHSY